MPAAAGTPIASVRKDKGIDLSALRPSVDVKV
jgi:hypothetical protein